MAFLLLHNYTDFIYFNDSRIIYIMILLDINEKLYEIK